MDILQLGMVGALVDVGFLSMGSVPRNMGLRWFIRPRMLVGWGWIWPVGSRLVGFGGSVQSAMGIWPRVRVSRKKNWVDLGFSGNRWRGGEKGN